MIIEYSVLAGLVVATMVTARWINQASRRDLENFRAHVEAFLGRRVVEAHGGATPLETPIRQAPAGLSPSQPVGALSSRGVDLPESTSRRRSSAGVAPDHGGTRRAPVTIP